MFKDGVSLLFKRRNIFSEDVTLQKIHTRRRLCMKKNALEVNIFSKKKSILKEGYSREERCSWSRYLQRRYLWKSYSSRRYFWKRYLLKRYLWRRNPWRRNLWRRYPRRRYFEEGMLKEGILEEDILKNTVKG